MRPLLEWIVSCVAALFADWLPYQKTTGSAATSAQIRLPHDPQCRYKRTPHRLTRAIPRHKLVFDEGDAIDDCAGSWRAWRGGIDE